MNWKPLANGLAISLSLCQPAHAGTNGKFCPDEQYLSYSELSGIRKTSSFYIIKFSKDNEKDNNDIINEIDARFYYKQLSQSNPPALMCESYTAGIKNSDPPEFDSFSCDNPGMNKPYDPSIGPGVEIDELGNATSRYCYGTGKCFFVRDRSGQKFLTKAGSIFEPMLGSMLGKRIKGVDEDISDGTDTGEISDFSKQFAFDKDGYQYFLIGLEKQGNLVCTYKSISDPKF